MAEQGTQAALKTEPTTDKTKTSSTWLDVLKVVLMPLVALVVGAVFNISLNTRQSQENNLRLYTEMMGKREEADSALRKDMFNSMLSTFLTRDPKPPLSKEEINRQHVLNLELLAYNFHESLDLGPLFKNVRREIRDSDTELKERLETVASEVIGRQLTTLGDRGTVEVGGAPLEKVKDDDAHLIFFGRHTVPSPDYQEGTSTPLLCLATDLPDFTGGTSGTGERRHFRRFKLELLDYDPKWGLRVRLYASKVLGEDDCQRSDFDMLAMKEAQFDFWVDQFDFPLIDNTRLSYGERCAVVLTEPIRDKSEIKVALAYFPGSRASLKEKPYYDELMRSLVLGKPSD